MRMLTAHSTCRLSGLTNLILAGDTYNMKYQEANQDLQIPLKLATLQLHFSAISQAWLEVASQLLLDLTSLELHNCYIDPLADDQSMKLTTSAALALLR